MAENSKIEWCDATFNPWIGCTKVSVGPRGACVNCYAEVATPSRAMDIQWGAGKPRHRTAESTWRQPLAWNRQHDEFVAEHGRRRRVFCASLADVFDNEVPIEWRADLFKVIRETPNLDWLLLTKRIGNVTRMLEIAADWHFDLGDRNVSGWLTDWYRHGLPPRHVWLGATVANQEEADRDIPKLLATPARIRFLSIEPMLGPIDITEHLWGRSKPCVDCPRDIDCACGHEPRVILSAEPALHWVICGGESGVGARPMNPAWALSLRDQCAAAGVPFLFKQWGEWGLARAAPAGKPGRYALAPRETPEPITRLDQYPRQFTAFGSAVLERLGKERAGRLLDGVEHNGFPA